MKIRTTSMLTLTLVVITFGFWISAILTPGWILFSAYIPVPNKSVKEQMMWNNTILHYYKYFYKDYVQRFIFWELKGNFFYTDICYDLYTYRNRTCHRRPLGNNSPALVLIISQMISSAAVLGLCSVTFFLLLLNFGSSHRVLAAGISMFLAALLEFLLIISSIESNKEGLKRFKLQIGDSEKTAVEALFPYSIMLAGESLLFSILTMYGIFVLFQKLRKEVGNNLIEDL